MKNAVNNFKYSLEDMRHFRCYLRTDVGHLSFFAFIASPHRTIESLRALTLAGVEWKDKATKNLFSACDRVRIYIICTLNVWTTGEMHENNTNQIQNYIQSRNKKKKDFFSNDVFVTEFPYHHHHHHHHLPPLRLFLTFFLTLVTQAPVLFNSPISYKRMRRRQTQKNIQKMTHSGIFATMIAARLVTAYKCCWQLNSRNGRQWAQLRNEKKRSEDEGEEAEKLWKNAKRRW